MHTIKYFFDSLNINSNFALNKAINYSTMENNEKEQEILFSRAVKAGKRIYYLDVKRNRHQDTYLAITESKKIVTGEGENATATFEKHKIFLYKEDFEKFATALNEIMQFVKEFEAESQSAPTEEPKVEHKYDVDMNFDI